VVVDRVGGRGGRRRAVHALAELVLDGGAAGGVEAGRGPAGQDGGHDGDARVLGLALGVVNAQRLEGREADGTGSGGHGGRLWISGGRGIGGLPGRKKKVVGCSLIGLSRDSGRIRPPVPAYR
jgi:hypothetical protein